MKIDSFTLQFNKKVIRKIDFVDGLNLITNDPKKRVSGNSVGKSTLSRILDYLFLGSIKEIYYDHEYDTYNKSIETLFRKKNVVATLNFTTDKPNSISRNLSIDPKDLVYYIDNEKVDINKYEAYLLDLLFKIKGKRPSLRILAPKFIRNDSHKMLHSTNFLNIRSTEKEYTELFLYLFGFNETEILDSQRIISNLLKKHNKTKSKLNSIIKDDKTTSTIKSIKKEISELEKNLTSFEKSILNSDPLKNLLELQSEEDKLNDQFYKIELKINNINETIIELNESAEILLIKELQSIYQYALNSIENVIADYEETLIFHGNLILQKKVYLENELPSLISEKDSIENQRNSIQNQKQQLFSKAISKQNIAEIGENIEAIARLKNELLKLEAFVERKEKADKDIKDSESILKTINQKISTSISNVEKFKVKFNSNLKIISKLINNEEHTFSLDYDANLGLCAISLQNPTPSPEGGKKKSEVIGFDLAYIKTISDLKDFRPNFTFFDSIEDIDINQIETIFEICNKMDGQVFISMLSDKLPDILIKKFQKNIVLLLSDKEKFFKIP